MCLPARSALDREGLAPILAVLEDPLMRAYAAVLQRVDARRRLAALDRRDGIEQQAAQKHDGAVRGAEMLLRTVGDRPHAFLHGDILRVDAGNAGEARHLLQRAIDLIVVRDVRFETEGAGYIGVAAAAEATLENVEAFRIDR